MFEHLSSPWWGWCGVVAGQEHRDDFLRAARRQGLWTPLSPLQDRLGWVVEHVVGQAEGQVVAQAVGINVCRSL